ncbi:histidine kinase [Streptomyces sp. NPDC018031]|uniref:sensor histidine kinase n=1 Tax=Streptomyces sp. NPDC018031 TaxID=3365033 RepID=UPI00378B53FB
MPAPAPAGDRSPGARPGHRPGGPPFPAAAGRNPRRRRARHGLRLTAGLATGAAAAVAELLLLAAAGLALLCVTAWPRARARVLVPVTGGVRRLAGLQRRRLARLFRHEISTDYTGGQALRYLAARWTLGVLGALVLLAVAVGAGYTSLLLWGWVLMDQDNWWHVLGSGLGGVFLLFLALQGVLGVATMEGQLARHFLGPSRQDALERRIAELASTRAGVVEAVHDERRRIERDLHDGVQQRLVVLGMLLGRARRAQDPGKITALIAQAHAESRQALTDLREVAWRVYPTALDEAGLRAALETVAERSPIPVRVDYALPEEPGTAARTVAYFVVSEAVTNAIKHSGATRVDVTLARSATTPWQPSGGPAAARHRSGGPAAAPWQPSGNPATAPQRADTATPHPADTAPHPAATPASASPHRPGTAPQPAAAPPFPGHPALHIRITDDGTGGADPAGSGLLGLARRVAALDGRLHVDSPPGGPTTVTAELPDPAPYTADPRPRPGPARRAPAAVPPPPAPSGTRIARTTGEAPNPR